MKSIILPAIAAVVAIAAFVFWSDTMPPECISKGESTALPWLQCKK